MKVFSYKKYVEYCKKYDMTTNAWAEKCDMQPSNGFTVIGTDGYRYLSSAFWCIEVDENGNEIITEEVVEEVENDEVY